MNLLRWITNAIAGAVVLAAALCAALAAGPQLFDLEPVPVRESSAGSVAGVGDLVLVSPDEPVAGEVLAYRPFANDPTLRFHDAVQPVDEDGDGITDGFASDSDGDGYEDSFIGAHQAAGRATLQAPMLGALLDWAWPWIVVPGGLAVLYFIAAPSMWVPRGDD